MVGMLLLKNIYNLSDEGVVARWMENPYMQYFTGEKVFQKRPPMTPSTTPPLAHAPIGVLMPTRRTRRMNSGDS